MQMAWGFAPPLIMEAAVRNGVFDYLDAGPKTVEETAAATGASVRGLRAIMNALVGFELLSRTADGKYELTEESKMFLVSTRPSFFGGFMRHTSTHLVSRWLNLAEIVRTGKGSGDADEEAKGTAFFSQFVEDLFPMNYPASQVLATDLQIERAEQPVRVLDVAAGSGVWGIGLAQRSRQIHVTALDWPGVLEITRKVATRLGVADRFTFVPADLRTADFGTGYQVVTLGHILHAEGEQRSRALLKKAFNALAPGGTVAIAEFLVNDKRNGPPNGLIFAVNMLVATEDGDTWSFEEISEWLGDAGFVDARTLEAPGPSPLILAKRAG
jgi:SAM-dependent methyltransferase